MAGEHVCALGKQGTPVRFRDGPAAVCERCCDLRLSGRPVLESTSVLSLGGNSERAVAFLPLRMLLWQSREGMRLAELVSQKTYQVP